MSTVQNQPIIVEPTAMVTLSFERYMTLKNVEIDRERYASQILEHQTNVTRLEKQIKDAESKSAPRILELEEKIAEYQQGLLDKDVEIEGLKALNASKSSSKVKKAEATEEATEKPKKAPAKKK